MSLSTSSSLSPSLHRSSTLPLTTTTDTHVSVDDARTMLDEFSAHNGGLGGLLCIDRRARGSGSGAGQIPAYYRDEILPGLITLLQRQQGNDETDNGHGSHARFYLQVFSTAASANEGGVGEFWDGGCHRHPSRERTTTAAAVVSSGETLVDWLGPFHPSVQIARNRAALMARLDSALFTQRPASSPVMDAAQAQDVIDAVFDGMLDDRGAPAFVALNSGSGSTIAVLQRCLDQVQATPLFRRYYHCDGGAQAPTTTPPLFLNLVDTGTGLSYCFAVAAAAAGRGAVGPLSPTAHTMLCQLAGSLTCGSNGAVRCVQQLLAVNRLLSGMAATASTTRATAEIKPCFIEDSEPMAMAAREARDLRSQHLSSSPSFSPAAGPVVLHVGDENDTDNDPALLQELQEAVGSAEAQLAHVERREAEVNAMIAALHTCRTRTIHEHALRFPAPGEYGRLAGVVCPFRIQPGPITPTPAATASSSSSSTALAPTTVPGASRSRNVSLSRSREGSSSRASGQQHLRRQRQPWEDAGFMSELMDLIVNMAEFNAGLERKADALRTQREQQRRQRDASVAKVRRDMAIQYEEVRMAQLGTFAAEEAAARCDVAADFFTGLTALVATEASVGASVGTATTATANNNIMNGIAAVQSRLHTSRRAYDELQIAIQSARDASQVHCAELQQRINAAAHEVDALAVDIQRRVSAEKQQQQKRQQRRARLAAVRGPSSSSSLPPPLLLTGGGQSGPETVLPTLAALLEATPMLLSGNISSTTTNPHHHQAAQQRESDRRLGSPQSSRSSSLSSSSLSLVPSSRSGHGDFADRSGVPSWSRLYIELAKGGGGTIPTATAAAAAAVADQEHASECDCDGDGVSYRNGNHCNGGDDVEKDSASPSRTLEHAVSAFSRAGVNYLTRLHTTTSGACHHHTDSPSVLPLLQGVCNAFLDCHALWEMRETRHRRATAIERKLRERAEEWALVRRRVREAGDQVEALKRVVEADA